ncbi:MAG: carbohydrate porin [Rhodospirillales bacterium]|nr:carbohydrate porin [Rhodospirillales bacterium]
MTVVRTTAAFALLIAATPALAADPTTAELLRELRQLRQRVGELEKRQAPPGTPEALEERVRRLEADKAALERSLEQPHISADEPPLATRVKAVEAQAQRQQKAASIIEGLDGIKAGFAVTAVGQSPSGGNASAREAQGNIRADATVTLPGGEFAAAKGTLFAHLRAGQGGGLGALNNSFASVNATAFQRPGADDSDAAAVLAEAWYQLAIPIAGELEGHGAKSRIEITGGKMDPFALFDKNKVANDETKAFINQAFVHNPLLDVGGDMGVDGFGFSPGLRVAYVNEVRKGEAYGLSVGIFESGSGAGFRGSLDFPFWIVQAETTQTLFPGLETNLRLYGWQNRRGQDFTGLRRHHVGVGFSLDQQVHDYTTLFVRYGHQIQGDVRFDRATTAGAEFGGSYWHRAADAVGVAFGYLDASGDFRSLSATVDADGDGAADFGYAARGGEQLAEIYYRFQLMPSLEFSPSVQYVRRPGANRSAEDAYAFGLRTQFTY